MRIWGFNGQNFRNAVSARSFLFSVCMLKFCYVILTLVLFSCHSNCCLAMKLLKHTNVWELASNLSCGWSLLCFKFLALFRWSSRSIIQLTGWCYVLISWIIALNDHETYIIKGTYGEMYVQDSYLLMKSVYTPHWLGFLQGLHLISDVFCTQLLDG